jgi:hypothetical protein
MTPEECAAALFRAQLPAGFSRRVFRVAPGLELGLGPDGLPDAIVVVEEGELELECHAGTCRRFAPGSMIPIARLPVAHVRSVGTRPLVLIAVSRAPGTGAMSFSATSDRTGMTERDLGGR